MSAVLTKPRFEIRPLSPAMGADIVGIDLTVIDDADFAAIERAWLQYVVLRFRGQHLDDGALIAFSRRFGPLDRVPVAAADVPMMDDPRLSVAPNARDYVNVISNVKVGGKAIGGLGNYEALWHSDMSYNEIPPTASLLYAIEVPPQGGNTSFATMYAAYESLPPDMQQRISGLTCVHDASRNSAGELRRGFVDNTDPRQTAGARHPLVRTHPVTRRKCLFLGRRRNAYVEGLQLGESEALLDQLWAHATQPEFCWTQVWQAGDLVIWDNRCAMHRRDPFDDTHNRIMHRTQICGDRPF